MDLQTVAQLSARYIPDPRVVVRYAPDIAKGLRYTLEISVLAFAIALVLGLVIALMRLSSRRVLIAIAVAYTEVFRGIPEMVLLLWVYYVLPMFFGVRVSPYITGIIVLSISGAAYLAEVYRSGISSVPKGTIEAARSLGMSFSQTFARIIFPQALRIMIPPLLNNYLLVLKRTSILMAIAVTELMYRAQLASSITFRPLEILTFAAVLYLMITYPLTILVDKLENKFVFTDGS